MERRKRVKRRLKMYEVRVTNTVTKETCGFLGQGEYWSDAVKEGLANVEATTDTLAVTLPSGQTVTRHQNDFEGEKPYPTVDAVWEE